MVAASLHQCTYKHGCKSVLFIPLCLNADRSVSIGVNYSGVWNVEGKWCLVSIPDLDRGVIFPLSLLYNKSLKICDFVLIVFW